MSTISKSTFENNTHYFLSFIIQGYTGSNKDNYKLFFETFIATLASNTYNDLLKQYINDNPLIEAILLTRQSFFLWFTRFMTKYVFDNEQARSTAELEIIRNLNIKYDDVEPKIWGRIAWSVLLQLVEAYSDTPTDEMKNNYKIILTQLQFVLPCHTCRNNYVVELRNNGITDTVLQNKQSLLLWYTCLKNNVNNRVLLARNLGSKSFLPELAGVTTTYHYETKRLQEVKREQKVEQKMIPKPRINYSAPQNKPNHYAMSAPKPSYTLYSKKTTGGGCGCGKK